MEEWFITNLIDNNLNLTSLTDLSNLNSIGGEPGIAGDTILASPVGLENFKANSINY